MSGEQSLIITLSGEHDLDDFLDERLDDFLEEIKDTPLGEYDGSGLSLNGNYDLYFYSQDVNLLLEDIQRKANKYNFLEGAEARLTYGDEDNAKGKVKTIAAVKLQ